MLSLSTSMMSSPRAMFCGFLAITVNPVMPSSALALLIVAMSAALT